MSDNTRKRKKGYYVQASKGAKKTRHWHGLEAGMKGFLITCNKREKETVREAYNLFGEYADNIYGPEKVSPSQDNDKAASDNESDELEEDIEKALAKEVKALKESTTSKHRRFQVVDSGANNCVFIKTTIESPDTLLHKIFSDLYEAQQSRSRFMLRVSPVVGTCRADGDNIEALAQKILPQYFNKDTDVSYSVMFKVRNNSTVGRKVIFGIIGDVLSEISPKTKVNLDEPDVVINVDVLKTVCCVGVVKDFFKFRKYNIQEVVKAKPIQKTDQTPTEKESNPSDMKQDITDCPEKSNEDELNRTTETEDNAQATLVETGLKSEETDSPEEIGSK